MSKPLIAIVGRPNVGKSSIFNALAGERISIVHDEAGVTRDRIYTDAEWFGRPFTLVDTGGLDTESEDLLLSKMREQVDMALESCDAILFLCDIKDGLLGADREIANRLRQSGKPVILAVNKCDQPGEPPLGFYDFFELGLGVPYAVSAAHKMGLGELMTALFELLPAADFEEIEEERIRVAIIGRPNVGKSSLINRLLDEERSIVSPIAGTTRDALDVDIDNSSGSYRFIDTAGLRRRSKIDQRVEKYSVIRTDEAIDRSDVCLIMLDASDGLTEQDTKVAGKVHAAGKAAIFLLNKWDLLSPEEKNLDRWTLRIREKFGFMRYAPILSISALSGQRTDQIFERVNAVYEQAGKRLGTGVINEVLAEAMSLHKPPQDKGKNLKIYYATQVAVHPPQIVFFINDKDLLHFSYERYLENSFREAFGFEGTPLRFIWRERKRGDEMKSKNPLD